MVRSTKGGPGQGAEILLALPDGRQRSDPAGKPVGEPGNLIRIMPAEGLVR